MTIRSIPGRYKGISFRSQLEIHWARWLDIHRMEWDYESEGFNLDGMLYLPDFWLPQIRTFLEVKGVLDTSSSEKLKRFARYMQERDVTVVIGESPVGLAARLVKYSWDRNSPSHHLGGWFNERLTFLRCAECHVWFWADPEGDLRCRGCGARDVGGSHIAAIHPNAGRHAVPGNTCLDCGALEGVLVRGGHW